MVINCNETPNGGSKWRNGRRFGAVGLSVVALASGFALTACSSKSGGGSVGDADGSNTINIGFLAETTGQFQDYGIPAETGAQLAIKNINATGGVTVDGKKYKLNLIIENDNSNPGTAASLASELVTKDNVHFMFGAISSIANAVYPITDASKVLFFEASSAATPYVPKAPYMVSTQPTTESRVEISLKAIKQFWPSITKIGALGSSDSGTSQAVMQALPQAAKQTGLNFATMVTYPSTATDYSAELLKLRSSQPDVLFNNVDDPAGELSVIQEDKNENVAPYHFDYSGTCTVALSAGVKNNYADNTGSGADLSNPRNDEVATFTKQLDSALHGKYVEYNYAAAWEYDFYGYLAKAIAKADTFTNTDKVLSAMESFTYHGIGGDTRLNKQRFPETGMDICQIENGKISVTHVNP